MKIHRVEIQNFMAIADARLELADRGLVLVQGVNESESSADSNGSGKSSLADAICWALYGITARGEEGDKVVNRFDADGKILPPEKRKDCWVKVTVLDDTYHYEITRYRKHKKHKNALKVTQIDRATGSGETDLTKGTEKLTQEVVNQILGCSYEVFAGSIYAGQEKMPDLPGMTDKQLKMLIEEASGATLLEKAHEEARTRLNVKRAARDAVANLMERANIAVIHAEGNLRDAEAGRDKFDADRVTQAKALAVEGKSIKANVDACAAKVDPAKRRDIEDKIKLCDEQVAAVIDENEKLREHDKAVTAATSALAIAKNAALISSEAVKRLKAKHDGLDHQIGCPCGTCARPFTAEDIAPAKAIAAEELAQAVREFTERTSNVRSAQERLQSVTDARETFRASMTDLSSVNTLRASLTAKLREMTLDESALRGHQADLATVIAQLKAKKDEINPFLVQVETAKDAIEASKRAFLAKTGELNAADKELAIAEAVVKVYSPAGVRAFLLDEVTPFLNEQTAKYLGTLSDGHITATWTTLVKTAKGELREKFSIEVENDNGGDTFGLVSGGEKRKVRVACALALQDLVARRATKPIELFIGDEIDDALDPAGLERLTQILEEKARERGSVFVISHSDIKDYVRNTITVRKKNGRATIEETVS